MVLFDKCCFCVPLKPGCLVIAYLNLIGSILGIILSIYTTIIGAQFWDSPKKREIELGFMLLCIGPVLIIFFVLSFAFAVVLLVGLHKNKQKHVKAYLKYCLVLLIIYAILHIIRMVTHLGGAIEGVVSLLVSVYFLLVVKSYHQRMLEDKSHHDRVQKV